MKKKEIKKNLKYKKALCSYLLKRLANKTNALNPITCYSLGPTETKSYIINKKYEKLAEKIINYYYKTNKVPSYCFKSVGFLLAIQIILSLTKPDFSNFYKLLENEEEEIEFCLETNIEALTADIAEEMSNLQNKVLEEQEETRITIRQEEVEKYHEYNAYLEEYSTYFHLDSHKVIALAQTLTNTYCKNFESTLSEETIKKYNLENKLNTPEAESIAFVHFLYRNVVKGEKGELSFQVEDFGYTRNEFQTTTEITLDSTFTEGEDVRLISGETRAEYMGKICSLLDANRCGCLAVSYSETGIDALKSPRLRLYNNVGGMRYQSGEFMEFPTLKAGIISHVLNLMSYPEKYKVDSIEKLWNIYSAEGEYWLTNFTNFYNDMLNNQEDYFHSNSNDYKLNRKI